MCIWTESEESGEVGKEDAGHVSGESGIVDVGVTWPWEQMFQALCFLVHKIKMD